LEDSNVAFSTSEGLKSCISKSEFESVMKISKSFYDKIDEIVKFRLKLKDEAKTRLIEARDSKILNESDFKESVQKFKSMLWDADALMYEKSGNELDDLKNVTDFLNRFQLPGEMLPYIDISFINRIKESK